MKTYEALKLNAISEEEFRKNSGVSYKEATAEIGVCSLTSVLIKNNQGVVTDKERVWMTPGGAWMKTSGYADIGTVKGTCEGIPVIREAKFNRVKAITLEEAVKAIGACYLAKVMLCDTDGNIIEDSHENVWLSLSGTYWARIGGHIDKNVGLTL